MDLSTVNIPMSPRAIGEFFGALLVAGACWLMGSKINRRSQQRTGDAATYPQEMRTSLLDAVNKLNSRLRNQDGQMVDIDAKLERLSGQLGDQMRQIEEQAVKVDELWRHHLQQRSKGH